MVLSHKARGFVGLCGTIVRIMVLTNAAAQKKRAKIDAPKIGFFIFIENARSCVYVCIYMCIYILLI
jgi:hypothetical protein